MTNLTSNFQDPTSNIHPLASEVLRTRRIKVMYIIDHLGIGGAQRQLVELSCALPKDRFEVSVVCLSASRLNYADKLRESGVALECIPQRGFWDARCFGRLRKLIRSNRPHIIQTWLFTADLYGRLAGWCSGVGLIISAARSVEPDKTFRHVIADRLLRRITGAFITNAKAVSDVLAKRERVPQSKLHTIYNGVDLSVFDPSNRNGEARKSLGLKDDAPLVGIIARLVPPKDHATFLRAAALVLRHIPHSQYLIVGDGPCREELVELSKSLGISSSVHWLKSQHNIADMLFALDVAVISSEYEGCSNAILEAMAMGKPVVASNVGGNPELVIDGKTGFLFPVRNPEKLALAMVRILRDSKMASAFGKAARSRVEGLFSLKRMVDETASLYEGLLERSFRAHSV